MRFPSSYFSEPAAHSTPMHDAQREHLEQAKDTVLSQAELATVDHDGKRLNERKWRWAMNFIGSL